MVHVIPTAVARGAQVYARALADELDTPGQRHLVLCLFGHAGDVEVDEWLGVEAGGLAGQGFDPRVAIRLRWRIRQLAPRAVVAHGGDALKYVAFAHRRSPVAYLAIGTLATSARKGARQQLWRAMVRRAEAVVAVSEDVAAECRSALEVRGDRLVVIPNGRDPAVFHPTPHRASPAAPPIVLFVGRMIPGKRPDRFIRVVDELRARGIDVRAVAAGDGPMRSQLDEAARRAGVELPGAVGDVGDLMRRADLLVFPSEPEGEGMPGVLIEAGLSGLPVVATDVAGVRDVVADGVSGIVVPVEDLAALVQASAELLSDRERRQSMGAAARARCNELFTMRSSATRWRELLAELPPAR